MSVYSEVQIGKLLPPTGKLYLKKKSLKYYVTLILHKLLDFVT